MDVNLSYSQQGVIKPKVHTHSHNSRHSSNKIVKMEGTEDSSDESVDIEQLF